MAEHAGRFGVEPIGRVLTARGVKITPSGYCAHRSPIVIYGLMPHPHRLRARLLAHRVAS